MAPTRFLLYGATGFVGAAAAKQACQQGLQPILAGRNAASLERLASDLAAEYRVFRLDDPAAMDEALKDVAVVLHCAGPYLHTAKQMVEACLRTKTHYLDITGELPVFEAIAARDAEARAQEVMLLPGVGFDVVPTDCLALHLKERLPSATRLTLAFRTRGSAGLPPGTQRTAIELLPYGNRVRRNGQLLKPKRAVKTRLVDFGNGAVTVTRLPWGDVFTAFFSTGIPNVEVYLALPAGARRLLALAAYARPLFRLSVLRQLLARAIRPGPTELEREQSSTEVWGLVEDEQGNSASARLYGPEVGVVWTVQAALAAVRKVLDGEAPVGFQTPALAYGSSFVLEGEGVRREDVD